MSNNIEQKAKKTQTDSLVEKKAEWQAPSLTKLDVSQTQGGAGFDDEGSNSFMGS